MQHAKHGFPDIQKRCPGCGRALLIRENRQNGSHFLGCAGYPECDHTENIPETLRLRLAGVPELPLFDDEPAPVIQIKHCQSCGAEISWGFTPKGKRCPFNVVDGRPTQQSHFETCPDAGEWSKR